jgi:broad specificity phosphatase PhoE
MICIIRHGQTELNSRQVLQGRSDYPLDEIGIAQARNAAEKLRRISFDAVYSSPLSRSVQTAGIVAPDLVPVIDERLIEMEYGPYEGMGLRELAPEVLTFFRDFIHNPAPEGMEPLSSVVQRAGSFLEDRCRTDGNILISTHAIAMKGILEYLTPDSNGSYWSHPIGNCAVYAAEYLPGGGWTVPAEI